MNGRHRRGPLVVIAIVAFTLLMASGGRAVLRAHVKAKTGRADMPAVSCLYCHRAKAAAVTRGPGYTTGYINPAGLTVDADGEKLFIAASGSDEVLKVDLATLQVMARTTVGSRPLALALAPDGSSLAVACRDSDEIVVLDSVTLEEKQRIESHSGPTDVVYLNEQRLAVTHGDGGDMELLTLDDSRPRRRLPAGREPIAADLSADSRLLAAVSRLVEPTAVTAMPGADLTLVDAATGRIHRRLVLSSSHLSEDIALSADGAFALVPAVRFRHFLPTTQVARGAVMTSAITYLETDLDGAAISFPLDEVNAFYADPSGIVLTPDESLAFIASGGANVITVVDVQALRRLAATLDEAAREAIADDLGAFRHYVVKRIATGANPRNLAVTPDGRLLLVAEQLGDSIAVINIASLQVIDRIDLGGPQTLTAARRGALVFHDATATFQGQFSCRSCHPDGHTDGLIWDFEIDGIGRNHLETRSLRGLKGTAPFKWNGKNPDLHTQCGPRFSRVLMRAAPFPPNHLDDLVTYIESLPLPPRRAGHLDADAIARGRDLFFRDHTSRGDEIPLAQRCDTCHRPPLFTDRFKSDVGTGGLFDTPHLAGVGTSSPYLHDGRALTLEEIWTVHSPDDTHGITNDLSKVQLNDLMLFLRTL